MKILCASMPADGHFNPLTGIAAHLAGRRPRRPLVRRPGVRPQARPARHAVLPLPARHGGHGRQPQRPVPRARALKGPKLISFDLEKFFVANVDNHFQDIVEIRDEFPFDVFICDGAIYAEQLVAEVLGVPVFAVGSSLVMPDDDSPPPFFGLRPARTLVGRTVHRVVRRMLASTMRAGVIAYNDDPRAPRRRPDPARRLPARAHGQRPSGLPQRVPGPGVPRLPTAAERRVRRTAGAGTRGSGPDTALPPQVLDADAQVVAVSQGTVDNADPSKLIVPTLEALADGPYVVVATTGGVQTPELRARFAAPNVVIEDFINYDDLVPARGRLRHQRRLRQCPGARCGTGCRWSARASARARTTSTRASATTASASTSSRTSEAGPDPRRGAPCARRPDVRLESRCLRTELHSYDPGARIEAALHDESLASS